MILFRCAKPVPMDCSSAVAIESCNGIAPQVAAQIIVRALRAAQPRFRYLVGLNAVKARLAKRLLGTRSALWRPLQGSAPAFEHRAGINAGE